MNIKLALKKILKPFLRIAGPAAVMTAGVMGAGSTTSLVLAGSYFGYKLLWVAVYTLPILVIVQDSASRIGIISGNKGMFTIMDEQIHPILKWFFLFPIIVLAFIANMGQTKVMVSSILTIFGNYNPAMSSIIPSTIIVVVLVICTAIFGGYKSIEKIMTGVLFIMALSFLFVSIKGFANPVPVIKGLIPSVPADAGGRISIQYIAAITAGAVAITAILAYPYFTAEAGYQKQDIPANFKKAILTFGVIFGIWSVSALVAGGSVLNKLPNHLEIIDINQAGQVLGAEFGTFGIIVFALGMFGAAYSTFIVVAQLQTYFILDAFNLNWKFNLKNKKFIIVFSALMLFPGITSFLWNIPALLAIVAAMVLSVLGTPIAVFIIIFLMNKKSFIGEFRASMVRNIILVIGCILTLLLAYYQIAEFINKKDDNLSLIRKQNEENVVSLLHNKKLFPYGRRRVVAYAGMTYDSFGKPDVNKMISRIKDLGVNNYSYLINGSPKEDLESLPEFCRMASEAGVEVWVVLVPPSEEPGHKGTPDTIRYAPYGLDYVKWAAKISAISQKHKNLTLFIIDDSAYNLEKFTPAYTKEIYDALKEKNHNILFGITYYENQFRMKDFDINTYRQFVEAVEWGYQDQASIYSNYGISAASLPFNIKNFRKTFPNTLLIPCIYFTPHSSWKRKPTEVYLEDAMAIAYKDAGDFLIFVTPSPGTVNYKLVMDFCKAHHILRK